jgi:flagellin-like hook-associated protein FlgL
MGSTLTINQNIAALGAQRHLRDSTALLSNSFQRLSSGLRINKASDDAAGLAVATSLAFDARVFAQGSRNLSDASSAYSIAEGAVQELGAVVIRIQELAQQSANGTLTLRQRRALNAEANALVNEYNRITSTASFNGMQLLNGSVSTVSIQSGYGPDGSLVVGLGQELLRPIGDGTYKYGLVTPGGFVNSASAADLNGDGRIDIISSSSGGAVRVLTGNGDGTFLAPLSFAGVTNIYQTEAVDVNGDGKLDLVTADGGFNTASVYLGNGNGTFRARQSFNTYNSAFTITAADYNGDGRMDIASSDSGGASVIFLGNGDGTFRGRVSYAAGASAYGVVSADFNLDGYTDIVTSSGTGNSVLIISGNGNGSFRAPVSFATGTSPQFTAVSDVNNDGVPDVLAPSSGAVSVLIGNGDGTLRAFASYATGANGSTIFAADINGDGSPDILSSSPSGSVSILFGNGDGTFNSHKMMAGVGGYWVTAADVSSDGRQDLLVADFTGASVRVLIGNGGTTTTLPTLNLNSVSGARSVIEQIKSAQQRITTELGSQGSTISRVQSALSNQHHIRENYERAASQIVDVDTAQESSVLVRARILQQSGAAILAQANIQPQLALQLLSGF